MIDKTQTFAERLDHLFATVLHPKGREFTMSEVEQGTGKKITAGYLSHLRTGRRENPTMATVSALAEFFKVKPDYFFGEGRVGASPGTLDEIALRSTHLSDADRKAILSMIDHILSIRGNDEQEEEDDTPPESDQPT